MSTDQSNATLEANMRVALMHANMRVALCEFLPGDAVSTIRGRDRVPSGMKGTIESISTGRIASVKFGKSVEKAPLRDCQIATPLGRRRATTASSRQIQLGAWSGEYFVSASGGARPGRPTRDGVGWSLKLGETRPVPAGGRVVSLTLKAAMLTDQGWGGTGSNGIRVTCLRHASDDEPLAGEDGVVADDLFELKHDRNKHGKRRREHTLRLPNDAFSPKAEDTFMVRQLV